MTTTHKIKWIDSPSVPQNFGIWNPCGEWSLQPFDNPITLCSEGLLDFIRFIPRVLGYITLAIYEACASSTTWENVRINRTDTNARIENLFAQKVKDLPLELNRLDLKLFGGPHVESAFYRDTRGDENTPVVLCLPGFGQKQLNAPIGDLVSDKPLNFMTLNYPGIEEEMLHNTAPSKVNCILAGLGAYIYLREVQKIPADQIHFLGTQFGGAVALEMEKILVDHKGLVICDRTFSSWYDVLQEQYGSFFGTLIYGYFWFIGEDFSPKETLASLTSGRVHVLNLEAGKDRTVPTTCDLFNTHVTNSQINLEYHTLQSLVPSDTETGDCHSTPLKNCRIDSTEAAAYLLNLIHPDSV